MKRLIITVLFLAVLAGGGIVYQTYGQKSGATSAVVPPARAVPVLVAQVQRKAMPVRIDAIGTVLPIATVVVKSRVDGQIAEVRVSDGQNVRKGDVLFVLDTRAAEAQLAQSQAQLVRDRTQLTNAQRDVQRLRPLTEKDFVSRQQMDQVSTTAAALEATVSADQAAVENLKVQLTYYTIAAPMDGRVGVVALKAGNAVKAQDTITMLTINQIKPIYIAYSVAQRELPSIRTALTAGQVPVEATIPGDGLGPVSGQVYLFDNQIDATTGTISLRAIFPNADERLWPGEFVNVTTTLRTEASAIVVPAAAVQVGQSGNYVFVVKGETAEYRPVVVSRTIGNECVVDSGVTAEEQVVVDGQLRLTNGSRIEIRTSNDKDVKSERSS